MSASVTPTPKFGLYIQRHMFAMAIGASTPGM
jgi:hypothetical protein